MCIGAGDRAGRDTTNGHGLVEGGNTWSSTLETIRSRSAASSNVAPMLAKLTLGGVGIAVCRHAQDGLTKDKEVVSSGIVGFGSGIEL